MNEVVEGQKKQLPGTRSLDGGFIIFRQGMVLLPSEDLSTFGRGLRLFRWKIFLLVQG